MQKIDEKMIALELQSDTGEVLYNVIKEVLESLNIPLANMIVESFDGSAHWEH